MIGICGCAAGSETLALSQLERSSRRRRSRARQRRMTRRKAERRIPSSRPCARAAAAIFSSICTTKRGKRSPGSGWTRTSGALLAMPALTFASAKSQPLHRHCNDPGPDGRLDRARCDVAAYAAITDMAPDRDRRRRMVQGWPSMTLHASRPVGRNRAARSRRHRTGSQQAPKVRRDCARWQNHVAGGQHQRERRQRHARRSRPATPLPAGRGQEGASQNRNGRQSGPRTILRGIAGERPGRAPVHCLRSGLCALRLWAAGCVVHPRAGKVPLVLSRVPTVERSPEPAPEAGGPKCC